MNLAIGGNGHTADYAAGTSDGLRNRLNRLDQKKVTLISQLSYDLIVANSSDDHANHSHSIVPGGLLVMSYVTRLTPRTSLMMRAATRPRKA